MKNNIAGEEGQNPPVKRELSTNCDKTGVDVVKEETPHAFLGDAFKKPSGDVHSKKNSKDEVVRDWLRCRCASGINTNENDFFERFPQRRYRRGDCLRMLRYFHQCYRRHTELKVVDNLWTLIPTFERDQP